MLASLFHNIQSIGFLTDIRESALVYPVIMSIHLICIAVFGGMILMTNARLLGWALTSYSVTEVIGSVRIWKRIGLGIMVTMGLLLGSSEADKYYPNPYFWTKLTLLGLLIVHSAVFRGSVYNNTEAIDKAPAIPTQAKVAAALSLVLWTGVACMGRLIAYWE